MARKKKTNQANKSIVVLFALLVIVCICGYILYIKVPKVKTFVDGILNNQDHTEIITSGDLSIHFFELGNKYTGDSIYIKANDVDILIDAGSRKSSAQAINEYLGSYVKDGILEYVIATHGHQDHIAGFVGTTTIDGVFDAYECKTIIDFPKTSSTSKLITEYYSARDKEIAQGAKHYTALECYNNQNGAKRKYNLADGIELEILYNYYYDHNTSSENDYSVCVMINQGNRHFLFTGDLEKDGEKYLVEYNDLPEVDVYKAGHHGSKTSSSVELLSVIKPKIVCVCCCAGSDEYTNIDANQFPTQDFVSRICQYTDAVYVTSLATNDGYTSFNGNIVVTSNKDNIVVNCSNNNIYLKDSEWFKKHRTWK